MLMKHIAVVGPTGVGKSTLVNVLKGPGTAPVTNDAVPCTIRVSQYDIVAEDVTYCIWDTRGWSEASERGAKNALARFLQLIRGKSEADRELKKFLRKRDPKIDLILFCIDARKIAQKEPWMGYNKIYAKFCRKKVKVAVVVSQMERDIRSTNWEKGMAKGIAGIEEVPAFHETQDTRDCKARLMRLIANCC